MKSSVPLMLLVGSFFILQGMPANDNSRGAGMSQLPAVATHYLDSKEIYEGHLGEGIKLYKGDDEEYDPELYRNVR